MNLTLVNLLISFTAVTASIAAPIATFAIGRGQIRANVLSANRQRWIEGFRELISSFASQVLVAALTREQLRDTGKKVITDNPALLMRYEGIALTATKLQLMTNSHEKDHQELVATMFHILESLKTPPAGQDLTDIADEAIRKIVLLTQVILKREWIRVKRGS